MIFDKIYKHMLTLMEIEKMIEYTTISIHKKVKAILEKMKVAPSDSYNEIILNLIEDSTELDETRLEEYRRELRQMQLGEELSLDAAREELGV